MPNPLALLGSLDFARYDVPGLGRFSVRLSPVIFSQKIEIALHRTTIRYPHMLAITTHASEGMCACEASNITRGDVSNWVETYRTPTRRLQASSSVAKQAKPFTYFWLHRGTQKNLLGKTIQLILPPFNYITHRTKSYEVNEVSYPNATRAPSAHEWDPQAIAANCATQLEGLAVRPWGRYS